MSSKLFLVTAVVIFGLALVSPSYAQHTPESGQARTPFIVHLLFRHALHVRPPTLTRYGPSSRVEGLWEPPTTEELERLHNSRDRAVDPTLPLVLIEW